MHYLCNIPSLTRFPFCLRKTCAESNEARKRRIRGSRPLVRELIVPVSASPPLMGFAIRRYARRESGKIVVHRQRPDGWV